MLCSFMMMAAQFLTSGCSVAIKDMKFCSPIPGGLGAVCDSFLTPGQEILVADGWLKQQTDWLKAGYSTECTSSGSVGDIKAELEKLCSKTRCSYGIQQAIIGLGRLETLGQTEAVGY
jgi:hypothetical protein